MSCHLLRDGGVVRRGGEPGAGHALHVLRVEDGRLQLGAHHGGRRGGGVDGAAAGEGAAGSGRLYPGAGEAGLPATYEEGY